MQRAIVKRALSKPSIVFTVVRLIVGLKHVFGALIVVAKVRFAANWAALSPPCEGQELARCRRSLPPGRRTAHHPLQKFKLRHHPTPRCGKPENCRIVVVRCCSVKRLAEIIDYCTYGNRTILNRSDLLFLPAISGCFSLFLLAAARCYFAAAVAVKARISAVNSASLAVFSLHLTAITASSMGRKARR